MEVFKLGMLTSNSKPRQNGRSIELISGSFSLAFLCATKPTRGTSRSEVVVLGGLLQVWPCSVNIGVLVFSAVFELIMSSFVPDNGIQFCETQGSDSVLEHRGWNHIKHKI